MAQKTCDLTNEEIAERMINAVDTSTRSFASIDALLGDPDQLMRPERLAALAPCRLSASRALINLMLRERWQIRNIRFDMDDRGAGRAVYRVTTPSLTFDFMALSFEPVLEGRTGRIIGTSWDMMGSLVEGHATEQMLDAAASEIPKLYAGRASANTLVWCRSNRSLRLFDHVVERLSQGEQPDMQELWDVGYLMRNTGLDGNGTFGTRSFLALEPGHPLRLPYHAQMLAAYLMREFSYDLVEHLAKAKNPEAAPLAPAIKRSMGLGNGSGLGLGFFVNTHPALINHWLQLRQKAIRHACAIPLPEPSSELAQLGDLLARAQRFYEEDPFTYRAFESAKLVADGLLTARDTLERLVAAGEKVDGGALLENLWLEISTEAWEVVAATLLELDAEYADASLETAAATELLIRDPAMSLGELREFIRTEYSWALAIDMSAPGARHYVWYKSRDAEEPRRGPAVDVTEGRNWALDLPGEVQAVHAQIADAPGELTVAEFLAGRPELRAAIERMQGLRGGHFHSPHMNMLGHDFRPVHIIRFMNAAFHGLDRTVDSLDRNVLGLLFQGAPTRTELATGDSHDWIYPARPDQKGMQE